MPFSALSFRVHTEVKGKTLNDVSYLSPASWATQTLLLGVVA